MSLVLNATTAKRFDGPKSIGTRIRRQANTGQRALSTSVNNVDVRGRTSSDGGLSVTVAGEKADRRRVSPASTSML